MNTKLTNTEVISSKMMRPRRYAERMGINYRTFYDYLYRGAIPYYKFQGILLIDVEEADAIIKGLLIRVHADHGIAKTGKKRDRDATSSTMQPNSSHIATETAGEKRHFSAAAKQNRRINLQEKIS